MDWQITPPVDGWHIAFDPAKTDGSQAVLSGEHPEATQLTINVTDASGKLATKTYSIAPRTSCWFAYTALETDGPELHVLDPILELPPPTALAHNQGVYDFAFSPNGKYLAYRFGADAGNPKGKHLALVDLSTWNDQLLTFAEDAVTAFAWSPDSSVLAVAFSSAGSSFLSGVRPSASATPAELSLTPAAVDSDLYWVGTNRVAFYAFGISDPTNPGQLIPVTDEVTAFYAELADGGFRPVILSTDLFYGPPIVVQPADDGFFMVSATSAPYIGFNWLNADGPTSNVYGDDFVAPSGHFMAELSSGKLKLIRAKDKTQIAASGSDQTCPKFLSWAKGQERMACVADVPPDSQGKSHSEIRIFDLDSVNNLTMSIVQDYCIKTASSLSAASACTTHEYDYTEASADLQPKLFSASGNYLAFTTGSANPASNYLYWADLRSTPFTLKWKDNFSTDGTSVSPTQLAFSPDEHYLLRQLGNALSVHTLDESVNSGPRLLPFFTPDPAQAGTTCSEDFASAPDRWCGSATRIAPFVWSPDSKFAAYRSADATTTKATLTVVDFAPFPDLASHTVFAADCAQRCSGQFVFQPQP
jgi:WD40 repeat protein